jgi:exosome complex RNA-binding protein Rrp42 (RNase PH superfamily)
MTEIERDLLERAAAALVNCAAAVLAVKPELDTPYPDRPEWTPYTRHAERPADEATELAAQIRKHLNGMRRSHE